MKTNYKVETENPTGKPDVNLLMEYVDAPVRLGRYSGPLDKKTSKKE